MMLLVPGAALAADVAAPVDMPEIDIRNRSVLQRGAKYFMNYCLSCHSAQYMRYSQLAEDLGFSDELIEENLIFTGKPIGETMTVALQAQDAEEWFGNPPPDLTLVARAEGP
ncbi:MAG: cytochrome c1, partial [Gemmatimonadales bacterium]